MSPKAEVYRCPSCRGNLTETSHGYWCSSCDVDYPETETYVDFLPNQAKQTPGSLTESFFEIIPPLYENIYFPLLYRLGTLPAFDSPADHARKLVERTSTQNGVVLDVACGTGLLSRQLAEKNEDVFALDRSRGMLTEAHERTPPTLSDRLNYCHGDAFHLPYGTGVFDAVTCSGAFYLFPDLRKALNEIHRVTNSGGHLAGMTVIKNGLLSTRLTDSLLTLYNQIENFQVHTVDGFAKSLRETGFRKFDYSIYGSVMLFTAVKS
ncbi:MAG: class I SAM-dependent methyltransferase [bacterium]